MCVHGSEQSGVKGEGGVIFHLQDEMKTYESLVSIAES